jgi:rare lipoprotein A (RlpA)-like double-psi beta-barrel protein
MKAGKHRHERQDHPRSGRTRGRVPSRRLCVPALAIGCAVALAGAPAQAATGGASATSGVEAPPPGGIAFTALRTAGATWYGPGLYGNHTACGQTLRPRTIGVAHRSLPCGTAVKFVYGGQTVVTRVIDRGPYANGVDWDLTNGARRILDFEGAAKIRYAIEREVARSSRYGG